MCLAHCSDGERTAALKHVSESGVIDASGVTITEELLEQILAAVPLDADGKRVIKACQFYYATFSGVADFKKAIFSGDAHFDYATFSGGARFDHATFSNRAIFLLAVFCGRASFRETIFGGAASFRHVEFGDFADFEKAIFSGDAWFYFVTFSRSAFFSEVRFEQARQFGPVLIHSDLELRDAQFTQLVEIDVSAARLRCRRTRFAGGVQFRLRWAQVELVESELGSRSMLTGAPRFFYGSLASATGPVASTPGFSEEKEKQIAKALAKSGGEVAERPRLLSLQGTDVAGLVLSNVTLTDCRFEGAHHLDQLRLESNVNFGLSPVPLVFRWWRLDRRQVIAEEKAWRAARRPHSHRWDAPWWPPKWQQPSALEPGQVAGLYRALRKGREDAKDEPDAADFYYGEMEMRRHARPSHRIPTQRLVERIILTAYWLVSGYGLRANRAVAWLAAVTAILAFAFYRWGFTIPPHPDTYWTSLLYSFRATLSLTDSDVKLTALGQLLQAVLRLTGPVLLGLALLALRGRVRR
jgi:uncharacterized protein YjbI with pentapeptide repeats